MADMDYRQLEQRLGSRLLTQRLNIQSHHVARLFGAGKTRIHIEHIRTLHRVIRGGLRAAGLYQRGRRNALNVQVNFTKLPCPGLPEAFDGFRLLHISDTHIDGAPELSSIIAGLAGPLGADACVITGDFREGTHEDYEAPARCMAELTRRLNIKTFGILGNHDAIEMVPILEDGGLRMLLNENDRLEHNGAAIRIAGVDDPHYYETDNLEKALEGIPPDAFTVLLAHSPEIVRNAAFAGVDLYLCGHTHAGQICLPGGRPVVTNSRCPPDRRAGLWTFEGMSGYTSRGAGTSSVGVRFNCPPEITLHELTGV